MKLIDKTTFKFLLVGVINTLVGTGVMFLFYNLCGFNYWFSTASNYIVGSIVSYLLNKYYTFQSKTNSFESIVKFVINISICYLVAYGAAKPFVYWICDILRENVATFSFLNAKWCDNLAMIAGMGIFVVLNYFGQRFFVFRGKTDEGERNKRK